MLNPSEDMDPEGGAAAAAPLVAPRATPMVVEDSGGCSAASTVASRPSRGGEKIQADDPRFKELGPELMPGADPSHFFSHEYIDPTLSGLGQADLLIVQQLYAYFAYKKTKMAHIFPGDPIHGPWYGTRNVRTARTIQPTSLHMLSLLIMAHSNRTLTHANDNAVFFLSNSSRRRSPRVRIATPRTSLSGSPSCPSRKRLRLRRGARFSSLAASPSYLFGMLAGRASALAIWPMRWRE